MNRKRGWLLAATLVLVLVLLSAAAVLANPRCAAGARVERVYGTTGDGRQVEIAVTPAAGPSPLACARTLLGGA